MFLEHEFGTWQRIGRWLRAQSGSRGLGLGERTLCKHQPCKQDRHRHARRQRSRNRHSTPGESDSGRSILAPPRTCKSDCAVLPDARRGGGQSTKCFDMREVIQAWVEEGRTPDRIIATGSAYPGKSRPLCP